MLLRRGEGVGKEIEERWSEGGRDGGKEGVLREMDLLQVEEQPYRCLCMAGALNDGEKDRGIKRQRDGRR